MKNLFLILIAVSCSLNAFANINKRQEIFPIDFNGGGKTSATLQYSIDRIKSADEATIVLTGGSWTITNNITFPSNVMLRVEYGSSFAVDNPYTVTMTGVKLDAGGYPIFTGSGNATGDAEFVYRWPVWGNTTRFDIGDGQLNESQIETWIENGDLNFAGGSTQTFDNVVTTNFTFTTASGTTLTVTTANITTGVVDNLTVTDLTLGAGASSSVYDAVTNNPAWASDILAISGIGQLTRGYIDGVDLSYTDTNTVSLGVGDGVCADTYFSITNEISHDVSTLSTSADFHYIYLDYSASTFPSTISVFDSTTEPTWIGNYGGYYCNTSQNDRLLGAVYSTGTTAVVEQFAEDYGNHILVNQISIEETLTGSPAWTNPTVAVSAVTPATASHALFEQFVSDTTPAQAASAIARKELRDTAGSPLGATERPYDIYLEGYRTTETTLWMPLGSSRDVYIYGNSVDNDWEIHLNGWRIKR